VQISDVTPAYEYCAFCGLGLRDDTAYRPDPGSPRYHSRECYEFSLAYPELLERLRATTAATREGDQED
jgi:hypothetical protein